MSVSRIPSSRPETEPPEPASSAAAGADSDWRSIPLVAGLELRVRRDAPPLVQRIAESIARGDWLP